MILDNKVILLYANWILSLSVRYCLPGGRAVSELIKSFSLLYTRPIFHSWWISWRHDLADSKILIISFPIQSTEPVAFSSSISRYLSSGPVIEIKEGT